MGPVELVQTARKAIEGIADEADFAVFLNMSLAAWEGIPEAEMEALGEKLFKHQIASQLHREAWQVLEAHRRKGHTLVLASSALRFQTGPMARELGIDHVLQTEIEIEDGKLTGRFAGTPLYGTGKSDAIEGLAQELGLDLDASFGYSNGREDVPMLELFGHAVAVEPDTDLEAEAEERDWPVLRCTAPGGRPGLGDVVRTAAFYGSFVAALNTAVGVGVVRRSRQALVDLSIGVGSDVALTAAGVEVDVIDGVEHLWSHRPAVFLFNHSSKMDAFVAMKLLREGFTGVAKADVKKVPLFGPIFMVAGVAFIDRSNSKEAIEALRPVVDKLRSGTSIVLSPEGTRSATPRMGPFKKGAFHIAMQAGVPIVPMLFRGVDQVQWRGAQAVRPGRVEVVVLPPVDTGDWQAETISDHRDDVREQMAAVLDDWPTERKALHA